MITNNKARYIYNNRNDAYLKIYGIQRSINTIYYTEAILGVVVMPLLTLIFTSPFVLISLSKKHAKEDLFLLKLFGIWLLCQSYVTLNDNFRIHLGIICAILIVYKAKINKNSKFVALIVGIISLLLSSLIYIIFKN